MERITFLELDRREGEVIVIGDHRITITVTRIRKIRQIVHLGINAPGQKVLLIDPLNDG